MGGMLVLSASMLELPGHGEVIGVEVDLRAHNREAIECHPLATGSADRRSSVDEAVVERVRTSAEGKRRVMRCLDSNHTHDHVLRELELYSPLVKAGSYAIVFETVIEDLPEDTFPDRPWGVGDNPMTAVREFLGRDSRFEVDRELEARLLLTAASGGYLKCVRD
jgi:cephalosporin hydroxylase